VFDQAGEQQVEVLVKFSRVFVCAVLFAAFSATLPAQQASTGYHSVACIKVKPECMVRRRIASEK
jgi:hypothetical protein